MSLRPGRRLLSGGTLHPVVAGAAMHDPHDPALALAVGMMLLDDVEATLATVPSRDEIDRLPDRERTAVLAKLYAALCQVDDARTTVAIACAEARGAA